MKNFPFSSFLVGAVLFVFVASCTSDPTPESKPSAEVSFSIDLNEPIPSSANGRISSDRLQEVVSVWVAIEDANGMLEGFPKMLNDFILDANEVRFELFNLPIGQYQLTKLWLEDANGEAIYAIPMEGSPLATAVENPLPMAFNASAHSITTVEAASLSTRGHRPENFGLEVEEVIFRVEPACDGGTFEGNFDLSTQEEIDNFGALCYSKIKGRIRIMFSSTPLDLTPLQSLQEIDELEIWMNPFLENLNGLENLTSLGWLNINGNNSLTSLDGLRNLQEIKTTFYLTNNPQLTHLHGLANLKTVEKFFRIERNPGLTNLKGLNNLSNCPSIQINSNENLQSVSDLSGLTNLGTISISRNPRLTYFKELFTHMEELESLSLSYMEIASWDNVLPAGLKITGTLAFGNISGLENMVGLPIEKELAGSLLINRCPDIVSLEGLENLESVGGMLSITLNPNLQTLSGLENLSSVGGAITVQNNEKLADFCALNDLFSSNPSYQPGISGNAYNPGINDFNGENCSE
ncbi:hypothetical protein [Cyclobacterium jeungdonense]|uniref:Leucine-rich repeat domain-containing protein n=1 Tax=Cyclobacterium jeungdonense TaxID=708087 RepID=A0ABT8C510_9BACT|nr:hypothetical protein [Cyclobacterium jeungdonense]MDN3687467.1 hypothetical protein [Cyclobacterium jeungdonense]